MDIRRLEAFCKVYELRSFSKAGHDLFLSQPTISSHISTLERELGVRLFDRMGRIILPTTAGEVLYHHAKTIFVSLEKALAEIRSLSDRVTGDLVVGGSTIPAHYLLPEALGSFLKLYPEVRLQLRVGDTTSIIREVEQGDLIVGVVGGKKEGSELVFTPVYKDELVLIAAPGLMERKEDLKPELLATLPWVMRESGSGTRQALEENLRQLGLDPRELKTSVDVESTQAVLQCVKAGLGVSITSRLAAQSFIERGEMVELQVKGLHMQRDMYCIYHERRYFFPAVRHFINFLEHMPTRLETRN